MAEHPQIVNEETLFTKKPTWYLIDEDIGTSKIAVSQKSVPDNMDVMTPLNDMERNLSKAIKLTQTQNTEMKKAVSEWTSAHEKEKMKPQKTTNSYRSLLLRKMTEAKNFSNMRTDANASLDFLLKWTSLYGKPPRNRPPCKPSLSPMLDSKWEAFNNESDENPKAFNSELKNENPPLEDPPSPIFGRKCMALNDRPRKENPSCKTPLSTIMEPEIIKTGKNE